MRMVRLCCMGIGVLLAGQAWADDCHLKDYGTLPVEMVGSRATTMVKINGTDTRFILDTGAFFNFMSKANADTLGLIDIRVKSDALASAARGGTLTGEQLTGGTFTISNLGMFGTRQFDAILNLPEVGILAVGAAEKRPVVVGDQLIVGDRKSVV